VVLEPAEQLPSQLHNALEYFLGQLAMVHREYLLYLDSDEQRSSLYDFAGECD
jgi:hypothetical protein